MQKSKYSMPPEEELAFVYWSSHARRIYPEIENGLPTDSTASNFRSWLKRVRMAQQLSGDAVAKKLGVSRAAYAKLENSESSGTIRLETLARAAEALDCELVYALKPKNKKAFSLSIWQQLLPLAKKHPWYLSRPRHLKSRGLAAAVRYCMEDSKIRRKLGWSLRKNEEGPCKVKPTKP